MVFDCSEIFNFDPGDEFALFWRVADFAETGPIFEVKRNNHDLEIQIILTKNNLILPTNESNLYFIILKVQIKKFFLQKLINEYQILPCQENMTFMLFEAKLQN